MSLLCKKTPIICVKLKYLQKNKFKLNITCNFIWTFRSDKKSLEFFLALLKIEVHKHSSCSEKYFSNRIVQKIFKNQISICFPRVLIRFWSAKMKNVCDKNIEWKIRISRSYTELQKKTLKFRAIFLPRRDFVRHGDPLGKNSSNKFRQLKRLSTWKFCVRFPFFTKYIKTSKSKSRQKFSFSTIN